MKVENDTIVHVMANYYRNTFGIDQDSDFFVDRLTRIQNLLDTLDGEGYTDLDILRLATRAFEEQVIKNS